MFVYLYRYVLSIAVQNKINLVGICLVEQYVGISITIFVGTYQKIIDALLT